MNLELFRHIFEKYLNIKFNEIPGSWVHPCGRTDILAFRHFRNSL